MSGKLVVRHDQLSPAIQERVRRILEKRRDRRYTGYAAVFALGAGGLSSEAWQKALLTAGGAGVIKWVSDTEKVSSATHELARALAGRSVPVFSTAFRTSQRIRGRKAGLLRSEKKFLSNFTHAAVNGKGGLILLRNPGVFSKMFGRKKVKVTETVSGWLPEKVKVTAFKAGDLDEAVKLAEQELSKPPFNYNAKDVNDYFRNAVGLASTHRDGIALTARHEGRLIGVAIGVPLSHASQLLPKPVTQLFKGVNGFFLADQVVRTGWRGRGIGSLLTQARLSHARRRGYEFALARANSNAASQLKHFKSLGFSEVPPEQFKKERQTFLHKTL